MLLAEPSSRSLTPTRRLAAVSLAHTLMSSPGCDAVRNVCSSLVAHFSVVLLFVAGLGGAHYLVRRFSRRSVDD